MSTTNSKHDFTGLLLSLLYDLKKFTSAEVVLKTTHDVGLLQERVNARGIGVLLVDLPKLGKIYDRGISTGRLNLSGLPRSLGSSRKFIFMDLLRETFPSLDHLVDPGAEIIRYTRTILLMFKKVRVACPDNVVRRHHHEFFELDASLPQPTRVWGSVDLGWNGRLTFLSSEQDHSGSLTGFAEKTSRSLRHLLDAACRLVVPLGEVLPDDLFGKHGPGRVSDASKGEDKYSFPNWPMRLSSAFRPSTMISHWGEAEGYYDEYWGRDLPSKLIAVPKTYDKPRLIASEPTAAQWCQQSLMQWLRHNLTPVAKKVIDFHSQEPSQRLALEGSLYGNLATVDLSSASDRLSCWTVERAFSSNESLLIHLNACRTAEVESELIGYRAHMRKFAAQGSAVTFPIQSLVYAAAAIAATMFDDGVRHTSQFSSWSEFSAYAEGLVSGKVRVFGDDIIVPKSALMYLDTLLTYMGLKINGGKTHHLGNFRESCGMDAWKGVEVTPVYLSDLSPGSDSLLQVVSWACVSNNAYKAGMRGLSAYMRSVVPPKIRNLIPTSSETQPGVAFFESCGSMMRTVILGKVRWNKKLHRKDTKMLCVSVVPRHQEREGWANLLQYFTEARMGCSSEQDILKVLERGNLGFVDQHRVTVVARWVPFN